MLGCFSPMQLSGVWYSHYSLPANNEAGVSMTTQVMTSSDHEESAMTSFHAPVDFVTLILLSTNDRNLLAMFRSSRFAANAYFNVNIDDRTHALLSMYFGE